MKIPAAIASLCLLTACAASTAGDARAPAPPPTLTAPCAAPRALPHRALTQAEVETLWGRDRAALRSCAEVQAALAGWAADVTGGTE